MEEKFDPVTGMLKDTSGDVSDERQKAAGFLGYEYQGKEEPPEKKKRLLPLIVSLAVLVAAIGAVIIIGIGNGVFLSDKAKVFAAIGNTFEEPKIVKALDFSDITGSDAYTVSISGMVNGFPIEAEYLRTKEQQAFHGSVNAGGIDMEYAGMLDDEKLMLHIPLLDHEKLFTYYYNRENNGYLMDILAGYGISPDVLNENLRSIHDSAKSGNSAELYLALAKPLKEFYQKMEFKKTMKKGFEVDGRYASCQGYETTVTSQELRELVEEMQNALNDVGAVAISGNFPATLDNLSEVLNEIEDTQMQWRFYLYKKKLAGIQIDSEGTKVEILFLGGKRRSQNMALRINGLKILEVSGFNEGKKETTKISSMGTNIIEWSYDVETGGFDATLFLEEFYYGESVSVKGKIEKEKTNATIGLEEVKVGEEPILTDGQIVFHTGAEIEPLEGEELDMGSASLYELMEYMGSLYEGLNMY